ncbi:MAG TPA: PfkB family carbohydrate kinase [Solirubrobacteraceae bacterium]|nr:PfkB family carbohydrate kinase [Solirubrobacteraceae bacterium]
MIAFVAASPSIDRLHVVAALRPGEIHRPERVVAVAGGKALNAARAAHALGADVHAVALLGGHTGRWVAAALEAEGVRCDGVPGPGETRICLSVSDGGALTEFYEPGPELDEAHWSALEETFARVAADATWAGVSGSLPPGAPVDGPARLLRVARAAGARVALDISGEALRLALAEAPDFVKVNADEAAELGIADPAELRRMTRDGAAAITHGADGMELATPDGDTLRATPPRLGAYPVGSGDAALGGFLAALDSGAAWPEALARAAEAAAANAQVPGAGRLG